MRRGSASLRGLTLNTVVLVLVTMFVVAGVSHAPIGGLPSEAAFGRKVEQVAGPNCSDDASYPIRIAIGWQLSS